jgi:hypothetical protein
MTIPKKRYDAFAGEHTTPSGRAAFRIYYLDDTYFRQKRLIDKAQGKRVWPPGHPKRPKAGWRWIRVKDSEAERGDKAHGPFSSSRAAYQAAVENLDGKV